MNMKAAALSMVILDCINNRTKLFWGELQVIAFFRKVLVQQAISVLVEVMLPGGVGISKEDLCIQICLNLRVIEELIVMINGKGVQEGCRKAR